MPEEVDASAERASARTRRAYDRIAPCYDAMEGIVERRYRAWRARLWSHVRGPRVLEVGVGTGKNLPYYPGGVEVTAIDLSPRMLERARRRAGRLHANVDLREGNVQSLDFADGTFDEVIATFVFCSVPDPVRGLREVRRVLKPGGRLLLLEHVRAASTPVAWLQDLMNPVSARVMGVNINRRTAQNVTKSGLVLEEDLPLGLRGIFRLLVARRQ